MNRFYPIVFGICPENQQEQHAIHLVAGALRGFVRNHAPRNRSLPLAKRGAWVLVFFLSLFWIPAGHAACGVDWVERNPLSWKGKGVALGNGQFVVTGARNVIQTNNNISTSPDGVTWTEHNAPGSPEGITYGNGQFVAVGGNGTIATSPEGVTWTARSSGTTALLHSVAWSGSQFVAVGESGTILTSPDGVTWTPRTSGTAARLMGVGSNGSQFVAVGGFGTILTSPDGAAWTARSSSAFGNLSGIAWSGSQFVVVGFSGQIFTSPDGLTWTPRRSSSVTMNDLHAITWGAGRFIAVSDVGEILSSPDGITWDNRGSQADVLWGIVSNGSRFVAVGDRILTSTDGVAWTATPSGPQESLLDIVWNGSQFVAVGNGGTILTSSDGVAWVPRNSGTTTLIGAIVWSGSQFVAVGGGAPDSIWTSPDGVNWTPRGTAGDGDFNDIIWTGSQFVAVGVFGTIVTSPDGVTWTPQTSGTMGTLYRIAWNGVKFIAGGIAGSLSSADGVTWTPIPIRLMSVIWNGSKFVGTNDIGYTFTSPDGVTWTTESSGTPGGGIRDIVWGDGQFMGISRSGTSILSSPDGVTWTPLTSGLPSLDGIAWRNGQLVAVGNNGYILTSDCSGSRPLPATLTVSVTGFGHVTSNPPGIACGATCSASFAGGSVVNLTATPEINNVFTGWSGDCSGTGACQVTMNSAKSVNAAFARIGTGVTGNSDLGLTIGSNPPSGATGGRIDYTGAITNFGPDTATGAQVSFALPDGIQVLNADDRCIVAANLLRCSLGDLAANGSSSITFSIVPNTAGSLTMTGQVVSAVGDNVAANNTASLDTVVARLPRGDRLGANLKVSLSGPTGIKRGKTAAYKAQVKNLGPASASAMRLDLGIPTGASLISSRSDRSCSQSAGAIQCRGGALAPRKARQIKIALNFANAGRFVVRAQATSFNGDPITANNQASVKTKVK